MLAYVSRYFNVIAPLPAPINPQALRFRAGSQGLQRCPAHLSADACRLSSIGADNPMADLLCLCEVRTDRG